MSEFPRFHFFAFVAATVAGFVGRKSHVKATGRTGGWTVTVHQPTAQFAMAA